MARSKFTFVVGLLAFTLVTLVGCGNSGSKTPTVTEAEVFVTINGQPLPDALITLTPSESGYGNDAIAVGTTDESGKAKLTCGNQSGACVGVNRVTILDAPPPEEARGEDPQAQAIAAQYQKKLKNRPIPPNYANLAQSDARLEIIKDKKEYKLDLRR